MKIKCDTKFKTQFFPFQEVVLHERKRAPPPLFLFVCFCGCNVCSNLLLAISFLGVVGVHPRRLGSSISLHCKCSSHLLAITVASGQISVASLFFVGCQAAAGPTQNHALPLPPGCLVHARSLAIHTVGLPQGRPALCPLRP